MRGKGRDFLKEVAVLLSLAVAVAAAGPVAAQQKAEAKKPNIVVIMTDDVGWGDLGAYGGGTNRGAPTPHLDRLAKEGMHFTNFYGQASCTAGRAAFLLGRYPIRSGLSEVLTIASPGGVHKDEITLADYLGRAGYRTVQIGKWHLGDRPEFYPTAVGFDEMYHMLPYYANAYTWTDPKIYPDFPRNDPEYMKWFKQTYNDGEWEGVKGQAPKKTKVFTTEDLATCDNRMAETAIKWINAHAKDTNPFFMYLCFMKLHNPTIPSPDWKGKSPGGHPYLDSLMELDHNSGRVVQAIRDAGIAENTLVVWFPDNGAWVDVWPDAGYTPFRGAKGTNFEAGFRIPAIVWWPGHVPAGVRCDEIVANMDIFPTVAKLAGLPVPSHVWQDKAGKPMIFDGVDQTDLFLGKGPSKRDSFIYFEDQDFGGIRMGNYKAIYTQRDTWLDYKKDKNIPALYNLQWDPQEQHDLFFSAQSGDRMWRVVYNSDKVLITFLKETGEIPNRPPAGIGGYITKSSIELLMKKSIIEEAFKNMMKQKPGDAAKKEAK
ncbi:MAG: arylsulfatase [Thermodesulfobacteriota bacterium]